LFLVHANYHVCRLIAPLVAARFIEHKLWLPFTISFAMLLAHFFILYTTPETSPTKSVLTPFVNMTTSEEAEPLYSLDMDVQRVEASEGYETRHSLDKRPPDVTLNGVKVMLQHLGLSLIFLAFVVKRIAFASENFIYQYASEKMGMKLSATVLARVAHMTGAISITSVILPTMTYYWHRQGVQTLQKDLWIMRVSLMVAVLSFVCLFSSKSFLALCLGRTCLSVLFDDLFN
jgi:hypothetical protein